MTRIVLVVPLLLSACAPAQTSSGPPSLSLVPANYYWHYSPRLHRMVRRTRRDPHLAPRSDAPDRALDEAARQVYRLRWQLAAPPQ